MKTLILRSFLCMLITMWIMPVYAQNVEKKSSGEHVYATFKEKGIDKAIEEYQNLKKKKGAEYAFDEHQLNEIAYKIMNDDKDAEAAKKLFWLNMQEYPQAVNPKDSYADVMLRLGNMEEAKKYYDLATQTYKKQGNYERNVARKSNAKLAVLNNKHQELNYLSGNWTSNTIYWNENNQEYKDTGEVTFSYANDIVLVGEMKPTYMANEPVRGQVWVITYNAQTDNFETAWIDSNLKGLSISSMKALPREGNKMVYLEEFKEDDDQMSIRHEILPQGNTIQWVMFESKNGREFRKFFQVDMAKHELTKK